MDKDLPIIDLQPLIASDTSDTNDKLATLAHDIDHACREAGFFYVRGHGLDPVLLEATFAAAAQFFALPRPAKAAIAIQNSPCHRGWFSLNSEILDAQNHPEGDYKEGIKIGRDLPPTHPHVRAALPLHGANQWAVLPTPAATIAWRNTMEQCYAACEVVARHIMHALALGLGLRGDYFDQWLQLPMATLSPLYYPPLDSGGNKEGDKERDKERNKEAQISAGAHTDFGCITLLMQKQISGLEIQQKDGSWRGVPVLDDMLVVNIGDMMARWTNNQYRSTRHRVINQKHTPRQSLAFFFDPDADADLSPLPGCQATKAHYPPATALSHLLQKIEASFVYRQNP